MYFVQVPHSTCPTSHEGEECLSCQRADSVVYLADCEPEVILKGDYCSLLVFYEPGVDPNLI